MLNEQLSKNVRPAAIAGSFYPADPLTLKDTISPLISSRDSQFTHKVKACIVPHAGLIYSGSTAAKVYSILKNQKEGGVPRILLIGPSHRVAFNGLAVPSSSAFETPLGAVEVDIELIEQLKKNSFVNRDDAAHQFEHCLEVQLPFLQMIFDNLKITPVLFSNVSVEEVAGIIQPVLIDENVLVIVSSDLSHFHDYKTANAIDSRTSKMIENFDFTDISSHQACGSTAVKGLLKAAKSIGLNIQKIALCNSGDTAGDKSRVVGYGSYVLY